MQKYKWFSKLIGKALWHRKLSTIVALLAIVLGTSVMGGLVNLYYDINEKMSKEFRAYGANTLIYPSEQIGKLDAEIVSSINSSIPDSKKVGIAPLQYTVVQMNEQPVVLVGTWMDQMKQVSPYWSIDGSWIENRNDSEAVMVGVNIAKKFDIKLGASIQLSAEDQSSLQLPVRAIVTSGGKEDNQIFVNTEVAEKLSKRNTTDVMLLSLLYKGADLEKEAKHLQSSIADVKVKPIKQMGQSEEKMLLKIKGLIRLIGIIIFVITILTVSTTMISMINERRKEVGLKKALGASNKLLLFEFLTEGVFISLIGSTFGIIAAYYIALLIGRSVFQADISFQFIIIPWTYLLALVIVALSFFIPVKRIMEVDPTIVLKGN